MRKLLNLLCVALLGLAACGGDLATAQHARMGGGVGRPGSHKPPGNVTPSQTTTLALGSATNTVPVYFNVTDPNYDAGQFGELQIATDSAFTSVAQDKVGVIDGDTWARLNHNLGFVDPSGTYYARYRLLRDDASGTTSVSDSFGNTFTADAASWSNTVTDTINISVATLSSTTGTSKSKYLNIATPFYQFIHNNNVGAPCLARATIAAVNTKFHMELSADGAWSSPGSYYFGLDGNVVDLNAGGTGFISTTNLPGNSGAAGFTVTVATGSTLATFYYNGSAHSVTLPSAYAVGDALIIETDTSAKTVAVYEYNGTTSTQVSTTVTLTSGIPSSWYAVAGGQHGTATLATSDSGTFNPGNATNKMTPNTGFLKYG